MRILLRTAGYDNNYYYLIDLPGRNRFPSGVLGTCNRYNITNVNDTLWSVMRHNVSLNFTHTHKW